MGEQKAQGGRGIIRDDKQWRPLASHTQRRGVGVPELSRLGIAAMSGDQRHKEP